MNKMLKFACYYIFITCILAISFSQNTNGDTQLPVFQDGNQVIDLSESFAIESEIDPDRYILGPADKIGLNIIANDNLTYILTITPTGELLIPRVGKIHIAGETINNAKINVEKFVRENAFTNAIIELVILNLRAFKVQVIGAVMVPGIVTITYTDRLTNVIEKTNGLHKLADEDNITISNKNELIKVSLAMYKKTGDLANNPVIQEGDVISIPFRGQYNHLIAESLTAKITGVYVTGFVKKPKGHMFYSGYTIMDYIGFSGGVMDMGSLKNVVIYRNGNAIYLNITDPVMPGDQIHIPANTKYRFLGNVSILQTITAVLSLYLTFQAATAN